MINWIILLQTVLLIVLGSVILFGLGFFVDFWTRCFFKAYYSERFNYLKKARDELGLTNTLERK